MRQAVRREQDLADLAFGRFAQRLFFLFELLQLTFRFFKLEEFLFQGRDMPVGRFQFRHARAQPPLQATHVTI